MPAADDTKHCGAGTALRICHALGMSTSTHSCKINYSVSSTLHMRKLRPREAHDLPGVTLQEVIGPESTPPPPGYRSNTGGQVFTPVAGSFAENCVFHGASRSLQPVKKKVSWSNKLRTMLSALLVVKRTGSETPTSAVYCWPFPDFSGPQFLHL